MNTQQKILEILENQGDVSVKQLSQELAVSRQMVHKAINVLREQGRITKLGKAPKVYYRLKASNLKSSVVSEPANEKWTTKELEFLSNNFLEVTATGTLLFGLEAFRFWCEKRKQPLKKTLTEFISTKKKYEAYRGKNGLISGLQKLQGTKGFKSIELDEIYYIDFYAIERFGKTNLGKLIHFAKQSQSRSLSRRIVEQTIEPVDKLIKQYKIDAVGFIPPTIQRQFQFMHYLEEAIPIQKASIEIKKVVGEIRVPQKALNKIEDRITNADASLMPDFKGTYNNVLLIDDAVGSGATLNETARKLKRTGRVKRVIGLAITGSYKGFEVISEA